MPRISQEKRSRIVTLREEGYSVREIAASEQVGLASVLRICKKKKETGTFDDLEKTDRPRLLTDRYERYAVRLLMTEQCSTAVEVKIKLKSDLGIDISVESVRRIFRRNGLSSKTKRYSKRHTENVDLLGRKNTEISRSTIGGWFSGLTKVSSSFSGQTAVNIAG